MEEKCRNLNWRFIEHLRWEKINAIDLIMKLDKSRPSLNHGLYELVKDKILPQNYCDEMKEIYSGRVVEVPDELKETFYNREINSEYIMSHPACIKYLKEVDLEVAFKYMPVKIKKDEYYSWYRNNRNETGHKKITKACQDYLNSLDYTDVDDNIKEL